jgi:peptidoglycan-N-acetylglucosamine deacetylase
MRRTRTIGLSAAGLLVVAAGTLLWTTPEWLIDLVARWYPGCLYRVPTHRRLVALTIDDGPDPESTPLILDQLRRRGARATFFLIGERIRNREQLVRAIVSEGHELGNHFMRDRPSIGLSPRAFESELVRAHELLAPYGAVRWARPGSGWYSDAMIELMSRHGYRCALGSVYPLDAAIPSGSLAVRYILRNIRPGSVVVLHEGGNRGLRTAKMLGQVLPELRRRGYRAVSLSELAGAGVRPADGSHESSGVAISRPPWPASAR